MHDFSILLTFWDLFAQTGSFIVSRITSPLATWTLLLALLATHLATNYKAVRCVALDTLNRQRTSLVFSTFRDTGRVPTPKEASIEERVLERSGVLRWGSNKVGRADAGVRFATILKASSRPGKVTELANIFQKEQYILYPDGGDISKGMMAIQIFLKDDASSKDQVKAWNHALCLAKESRRSTGISNTDWPYDLLRTTLRQMDDCFEDFMAGLVEAGWDVDTASIETRTGYRLCVLGGDDGSHQDALVDSKKSI